jgi:hypothetical protein
MPAGISTTSSVALCLHLLCAFAFVSANVALTVVRLAAMRHARSPAAVATLLLLGRTLVPVIIVSLLALIAFGAWTGASMGHSSTSLWLGITYGLVAWMALAGVVAGRVDKQARLAAVRLADDTTALLGGEAAGGDKDGSDTGGGGGAGELVARLRNPVALALHASILVAIVAVMAVNVFRPGETFVN